MSRRPVSGITGERRCSAEEQKELCSDEAFSESLGNTSNIPVINESVFESASY